MRRPPQHLRRLLTSCVVALLILLLAAAASATTGYTLAGSQLYAIDLEGSDFVRIGSTSAATIRGLVADSSGQLLAVAGLTNPLRLLSIDRSNAATVELGEFVVESTSGPSDLALDSAGRLWLLLQDRLYELSPIDGSVLRAVDLQLPVGPASQVFGLAAGRDRLYSLLPGVGPQTDLVGIDPFTGAIEVIRDATEAWLGSILSLSLASDSIGNLWIQFVHDPSLVAPPIVDMYWLRIGPTLTGPIQITAKLTSEEIPVIGNLAVAAGPFDRGVIDLPALGEVASWVLALLLLGAAARRLRSA